MRPVGKLKKEEEEKQEGVEHFVPMEIQNRPTTSGRTLACSSAKMTSVRRVRARSFPEIASMSESLNPPPFSAAEKSKQNGRRPRTGALKRSRHVRPSANVQVDTLIPNLGQAEKGRKRNGFSYFLSSCSFRAFRMSLGVQFFMLSCHSNSSMQKMYKANGEKECERFVDLHLFLVLVSTSQYTTPRSPVPGRGLSPTSSQSSRCCRRSTAAL